MNSSTETKTFTFVPIFDWLEKYLDLLLHKRLLHSFKVVAVYAALIGFIGTIFLAYLENGGYIHSKSFHITYFTSVYVAFSVILFYEILAMIFVLPESIARSNGRQYQLMSLVLIRHVFEKAGTFQKIHDIYHDWPIVLELMSGVFGSLLIFYLVAVYRQIQPHKQITQNLRAQKNFIIVKKMMAVLLTGAFIILGIYEFFGFITDILHERPSIHYFGHDFYSMLFNALIFVDILTVIVAMNYSETYHVVFRNTGLMISTVILRISFTSDLMTGALLTAMAVSVGITVTIAYNHFIKIDDTPRMLRHNDIEEESPGEIQNPDNVSKKRVRKKSGKSKISTRSL